MEWSSAVKCIIQSLPARYGSKLILYIYQMKLGILKEIIDKVPEQELMALLSNVHKSQRLNLAEKTEIVRLITVIKQLLELVEQRSKWWHKLMMNNDNQVVESLKTQFSNYWLWIIAIYLLQEDQSECKRLVIKYRLLEHIQHLNEYSLYEAAALPNEANELYLAGGELTPKGNFFKYQDKIAQLLNHIRLTFLPQE